MPRYMVNLEWDSENDCPNPHAAVQELLNDLRTERPPQLVVFGVLSPVVNENSEQTLTTVNVLGGEIVVV